MVDPSMRYVMVDSQCDDEISLIDLWLVLTKRRSLFLAIVLLVLLAGVSLALTMPEKFNYSTAIEIGGVSYSNNGKLVYVEDPSSVLAKIKQSYIPFTIKTYLEQNPEFDGVPEIKAKLEKNSSIIFIDIKGAEKHKKTYIQLLNSVVDTLKQDHKRKFLLKVKNLELSKNQMENEIVRLKKAEQLLLSQSKRLDKKEVLLMERIKETRQQLKASAKMKKNTATQSHTEDTTLSLIMMENELRMSREVLADLEEQLQVALENDRDEILNQQTENQQQQIEKTIMIEKLIAESNNLLETRAITAPIQSVKPVGLGKKLIVVISLLAGVFLALFAVFFAEFISKAKEHQASL